MGDTGATARAGNGTLVVFTSIYGEGYRLAPPPPAPGVDYVCLTDQRDLDPQGWDVVVSDPLFPADPTRSARDKKLRPHRWLPGYVRSIYVDPSVELTTDPHAVWDLLMSGSPDAVFGAMLHSFRETVLDEFAVVMREGLESEQVLYEHLRAYVLTDPAALERKPVWSGMIARRHLVEACIDAMDDWFAQVLRYSRRDQLSLPAVLSRMPEGTVSLVATDNSASDVHRWPRAGYARPARYYAAVADDLVPAILRSRVTTEAAEAQVRAVVEERDAALAERDAARAAYEAALVRVDEMLASDSWRVTAPLRSASDLTRRLRGDGRRDLVRALPSSLLRRRPQWARYAYDFQITAEAMAFVRDRLPPGGSLLVFGVGRDSTMWASINRGGRTAFLEDQPEWVEAVRTDAPDLELHEVAYRTSVEGSEAYADVADIPLPDLPPSVCERRWDVVVVDGPRAHSPDVPGRASSIGLAARLAAPGGWVLVDDIDRPHEQRLTGIVFGRPPDLVLDPERPVAAYRV